MFRLSKILKQKHLHGKMALGHTLCCSQFSQMSFARLKCFWAEPLSKAKRLERHVDAIPMAVWIFLLPSYCCLCVALGGGGECWCFDKLLAQACSHFEREPIEDCEHFVYSHFNQLANNIFLHEHLIKWEKQLIHQPEIEKEVLRKHAIFCPNSSDCCSTHSRRDSPTTVTFIWFTFTVRQDT